MRTNQIFPDFFPSINRCVKSLTLLVVVCGAAGILYFISPNDSGVYPPCPFNALTDLHCPGCGTLRGLHELLHGHIGKAFGLNLLMILSLPFIGYSFVNYVVAGIRDRPARRIFIPSEIIWALLGIVILFWILRNLPVYPFAYLAP